MPYNQWIVVDYAAPVFIDRVQILWEAACAANYDLQTSRDATNWTTMKSITGNTTAASLPGTMPTPPTDWSKSVDTTGLSGVGRYLRVNATLRCPNNTYGYSIWEMRSYGDTTSTCMP